jgi:hypothetical protein
VNEYLLTMKNFSGEAVIGGKDEDAVKRKVHKRYPEVKIRAIKFLKVFKKGKKK